MRYLTPEMTWFFAEKIRKTFRNQRYTHHCRPEAKQPFYLQIFS
jgi:hypothetical protein